MLDTPQQKMLVQQRVQQLKHGPLSRKDLSPWNLPRDTLPWGDSDNSLCEESFSKDSCSAAGGDEGEITSPAMPSQTTELSAVGTGNRVTWADWVNGELEDDDVDDSDFEPDRRELGQPSCDRAPETRTRRSQSRVLAASASVSTAISTPTSKPARRTYSYASAVKIVDEEENAENVRSAMNRPLSTPRTRQHTGKKSSRKIRNRSSTCTHTRCTDSSSSSSSSRNNVGKATTEPPKRRRGSSNSNKSRSERLRQVRRGAAPLG